MQIEKIKQKYEALSPFLNERSRRIFAATEAKSIGRGGITIVSKATGLNRNTIARGIKEISVGKSTLEERVRKHGGGRKTIEKLDKCIKPDLENLVEPTSRGDPESPLRWTTKSLRNLAGELRKKGHKISHETVSSLLRELNYSLQGNVKTKEGTDHPDRNAQFEYINEKVKQQQNQNNPVISVDAKKKEIVGNYKNAGRDWQPKGNPIEVKVHDFLDKKLGKICPYGVYDLSQNNGWVSVGIDHDTAAFAVESIRQWWKTMGKEIYHKSDSILITADAGGSNGYKNKLWKIELQKLANKIKKPISVCHFPPGTSKWNKIEHRLFSFISSNWRANPLISHEVIVNLISSTTTKNGLKVRCRIDERKYPTGIKISKKQ
ncbi:MAG: ISAzo13 family transposase, partial [archaeon]